MLVTMTEAKRMLIKCSLLSLQPASDDREEGTIKFTEALCRTDWQACMPDRLPLNCPDNRGSRLISAVVSERGRLPQGLTVVTETRRLIA